MLKGLPVFTIQQNALVTHILVNPFIVYRSSKAPNPALLVHFKDTAIRLMTKKGLEGTPEQWIS